jgi:DNA-binding transcriptional LysR family regulator
VRELEETLGVPLLHRTTRSVEPTAYGTQLLECIQKVLADLDTIVRDFKGETDLSRSRLTIACTPTVVNRVLLQAMEKFHERYPETTIRVLDVGSRGIAEALLAGEAELGIGPPFDDDPDFEIEPFMDDPFVAVVPKNHVLATKRTIEFIELLAYPFISLRTSNSIRSTLERAAVEAGIKFSPAYELHYLHSVWGMVRAGLGVTAIPTATLPLLQAEGLKTIPCTSPELSRTICMIRRKDEKMSLVLQEFLSLLHDGKQQVSQVAARTGERRAKPIAPAVRPLYAADRGQDRRATTDNSFH